MPIDQENKFFICLKKKKIKTNVLLKEFRSNTQQSYNPTVKS